MLFVFERHVIVDGCISKHTTAYHVFVDSDPQTQTGQGRRLWLWCPVIVVVRLSIFGLGECCFPVLLGLIARFDVGLSIIGFDSLVHGPLFRKETFAARYVRNHLCKVFC